MFWSAEEPMCTSFKMCKQEIAWLSGCQEVQKAVLSLQALARSPPCALPCSASGAHAGARGAALQAL